MGIVPCAVKVPCANMAGKVSEVELLGLAFGFKRFFLLIGEAQAPSPSRL